MPLWVFHGSKTTKNNIMDKGYFEWLKTPKMDVVFLATTYDKMLPSVIQTPNGPFISQPGRKELAKGGRLYVAPPEIADNVLEEMAKAADVVINNKKTVWECVGKFNAIRIPKINQ